MSKDGAYILVVDDEIEIIRALQRGIKARGYRVLTASTGAEALERAFQQHPDLIILDLNLPDMSGQEVCQRIREHSNVPIIVLSVHDAEREKVQLLALGADDYIVKPFGIDEILARIRVALRHVAQNRQGTEPVVQVGALSVDLSLRRVQLANQVIELTPTEYDLLKVFLAYRGKILTRQMLLSQVWGSDAHDRAHSLHVYMAQLRRKIEPVPEHPRFIRTIPGVGYCMDDYASDVQC